ncbi:TPA: hypothetical protein ACOJNU_002780 [Pseudomonas putida]
MYEVEYHDRIDEIRKRLASYKPGSVVARVIEHLHNSQHQRIPAMGMPWIVLFMLKMSMQESAKGNREMTNRDFGRFANSIYRLQHLACPLDGGAIQLMMRPMVLQQAWYQGSAMFDVKALTRQMLWFVKPDSIYSSKFQEVYGFTLEQYYLLSLYLIVGVASDAKGVVGVNLFDLIVKVTPSIPLSAIVGYLTLLTVKPEGLRAFFVEHTVPGELYQQSEYFQTTPLRKKPLLLNGEEIYILHPKLFSRSISMLVPDLLKVIKDWGPERSGFKNYFGFEMEYYIRDLLSFSKIDFVDENQLNGLCRSESVAAGKMADYLIPGEVNVLFESKAIEPGDIVSSVFDPELLRGHLKSSFIKGVEQCQESVHRLRQLKSFKDATFLGVVVTHEDFWFASAADIVEYVDPELEARMLEKFGAVPVPFENILFITIDIVEGLIDALSRREINLPEVLADCIEAMKTPAGKRFTMSHLVTEKMGNKLKGHPLLMNKADEWLEFFQKSLDANAKLWGGRVQELFEFRRQALNLLHLNLDSQLQCKE